MPNVRCCVCQKWVYRRPISLLKSKGRAFCSSTCFGKICQRPTPCPVCGKAVLATAKRRTCGDVCSKIWSKSVNRKHCLGRKPNREQKLSTRSYREAVYANAGAKCKFCPENSRVVLVIHHKLPKKKGGTDAMDNLVVVCRNCHAKVHAGLPGYCDGMVNVPVC